MVGKEIVKAKDLKNWDRIFYKNKPTSVYDVVRKGNIVSFRIVGVDRVEMTLDEAEFEKVNPKLDTLNSHPVAIPRQNKGGRSVD
jgi:hypothetical protein